MYTYSYPLLIHLDLHICVDVPLIFEQVKYQSSATQGRDAVDGMYMNMYVCLYVCMSGMNMI